MNKSEFQRNAITKPMHNMFIRFICPALVLFCMTVISFAQKGGGQAQKDSRHPEDCYKEGGVVHKDDPAYKLKIPDTEVITQDGKQVKFYKDLVKGKKVMINFIYTSCPLTCPMAGRNFAKLQEQIGEDVFLISVSTDPAVDTPKVLEKWGEKFKRGKNWTLVTGNAVKIKELVIALTGSSPRKGLHSPFIILFDEATGKWDSSSSLVDPAVLIKALADLRKPSTK